MQSSVSSIKHLSTEVSDFPSAGNISGWLFSLFYAKSCMAFMSKVIIPFFFSRNFSSLSCNNRMKSYLLLNDHIFDECLWKYKLEGKEIHDAECYHLPSYHFVPIGVIYKKKVWYYCCYLSFYLLFSFKSNVFTMRLKIGRGNMIRCKVVIVVFIQNSMWKKKYLHTEAEGDHCKTNSLYNT